MLNSINFRENILIDWDLDLNKKYEQKLNTAHLVFSLIDIVLQSIER